MNNLKGLRIKNNSLRQILQDILMSASLLYADLKKAQRTSHSLLMSLPAEKIYRQKGKLNYGK